MGGPFILTLPIILLAVRLFFQLKGALKKNTELWNTIKNPVFKHTSDCCFITFLLLPNSKSWFLIFKRLYSTKEGCEQQCMSNLLYLAQPHFCHLCFKRWEIASGILFTLRKRKRWFFTASFNCTCILYEPGALLRKSKCLRVPQPTQPTLKVPCRSPLLENQNAKCPWPPGKPSALHKRAIYSKNRYQFFSMTFPSSLTELGEILFIIESQLHWNLSRQIVGGHSEMQNK